MSLKWFREIKVELQRSGISVINMEQGRKHMKMRITDGKASSFIFVSVSPSDHRAIRKVLLSAKQTLAKSGENSVHANQ